MTGADQPRAVVVTGLGLLTGLGLDAESTWRGLMECRRPARRYQGFDPKGLDSPFGYELPPAAEDLFVEEIKSRHREQMTRGTMISVVAAQQAALHAGLDFEKLDRERVGVVAGATGTGYVHEGPEPDDNRILRNMASASAAWISLRHRLRGPSMVVSAACASGPYALHVAHGLIRDGDCDVVLAGAGDSTLNALDVRGFGALLALSERQDQFEEACRPFDAQRAGFVMGEGGAMMVLESEEHALARGARILAALPRPGVVCEGYNILSPEPGGAGMARAMRAALSHACLAPEQVGYLNAHGTSTNLNDLYETQAIKAVFGAHAKALAVSSTKGATGHCLAAAGAVEAGIALLALDRQVAPPTLNLTTPDPQLDLDFVPLTPRPMALAHVMSNSFAFGGQNGVCVLSRYEGRRA
jgi:3-oxoacyl-[acyl-carrier-protein] synthase II